MFDLSLEMSRLPEPITEDKPPLWSFWRHDLWELAQCEPAQNFTQWPCVKHCMLNDHWPELVEREKTEMLRVSGKLPADPYDYNLSLERTNLRQLYHLWKWEQVTGKKIADLETIVEIGGGFGAACQMAYRMGFKGKYTIYDLPEFSLLQQWYLSEAGVTGVEFVTDLQPRNTDLLIGIYSLSEMPLETREDILQNFPSRNILTLYSGKWETYDNVGYFQKSLNHGNTWATRWFHEEATWHNDPGNYYSIGY